MASHPASAYSPYRKRSPTGRAARGKVCFADKESGAGREEYRGQICLDGQEPDADRELELGRFKLQPGFPPAASDHQQFIVLPVCLPGPVSSCFPQDALQCAVAAHGVCGSRRLCHGV